jgi:signal transduction histidine kinase
MPVRNAEDFPAWYGWVEFGTMAAGGATVTVVSAGKQERPAVFALLVSFSVAGWLLCTLRRIQPGSALFTVSVAVRMAPLIALQVGGTVLGTYETHGRDQAMMMTAVWLVGESSAIGRRRDAVLAFGCGVFMAVGRGITDPHYDASAIWVIAMFTGLAVGLMMRALLADRDAQRALTGQAATAERQRIAREVHDVIAHSLTVAMLHLTAARLAVGRGDNAAATEAHEEAEKAGRTSLSEIRNTVGLLRADGSDPDNTPLPSAEDVPALVDGYRAAGLNVSLALKGDLDRVDPAAGLALYRIVQESLTNAGRHAPGAGTAVHIDVGPPLEVDVSTDRGASNVPRENGLGLAGMAERAAALGGVFEAGQQGNGWRVFATLP